MNRSHDSRHGGLGQRLGVLAAQPWVCLALILVVGGFLRLQALGARYPEGIRLAGSALEYRVLAEHMLHPGPVGPPGNPLGMPLLLAVLFAALPWRHDIIQVLFTTGCGLALVPLVYKLARPWVGTVRAMLVAALVAVNPAIVGNSVVGTTEEVFAVCLLLLLVLREGRPEGGDGVWQSVLLGVVAAGLVLVRKDGVLLLAPLVAGGLIYGYRGGGWRRALCLAGPLLLVPLLALAAAGWYQDVVGIKSSYWRGARAYYWFDFFRGRMPWTYGFYARLNLSEWWFGMHTLAEMFDISLRSTGRTLLAIGAASGGQAVLALALAGTAVYAQRQRDLLLPLAIPLCLVPQLLWIYFSSDVDAFRYIVRIIPLVLVLAAVAEAPVVSWLGRSVRLPSRWQVALRRPGVLLGGMVALGMLLPGSAYQAVLPQVSCSQAERDHRLGEPIYKRLGALWKDVSRGTVDAARAQQELVDLQRQQPRYAVTRYVQGLVAMHQGDLETAGRHFAAAVQGVPRFAEAAAWLAEVEMLRGDLEAASRLLDASLAARPDFSLLSLLRADAYLLVGDPAGAARAYRRYLHTNIARRREALKRAWRLLARRGMSREAEQVEADLENLEQGPPPLLDELLWDYLSYDLAEIRLPLPFDRDVYLNLGLAEWDQDRAVGARRALEISTQVMPQADRCWSDWAWMRSRDGALSAAAVILRGGLRHCGDSVLLRHGLASVQVRLGLDEQAAALCVAGGTVSAQDSVLGEAAVLLRSGKRDQAAALLTRTWTLSTPVIVLPLTRTVLSMAGSP